MVNPPPQRRHRAGLPPIGERVTNYGPDADSGFTMPKQAGPGTPAPGDEPVQRSAPPPPDQRRTVFPRDAHVEVRVEGRWYQGLLIEQVQDGSRWSFHVAYLIPDKGGMSLMAEWVGASNVRRRHNPE